MIEFSKDHSSAWMEMMSAYQIFRAKLFDWAHEPDQKKQKDLLLELDSWENRDIHRRMLVVDLLRSTEMWDEKALLLVLKELTAIALQEQDEIAAYARMALSKIKDPSERLTITDEVLRLSVVEGEKAEPDPVIFHNGCLLPVSYTHLPVYRGYSSTAQHRMLVIPEEHWERALKLLYAEKFDWSRLV